MNVNDTRRYDMLVRVRDFGTLYGHLFPQSSVAPQKFEEVANAVKWIDAHALTQITRSIAATANQKRKARQALDDALQAIGQTASVLAKQLPALDELVQMPKPATDQGRLIAGRKFARDVQPFMSQFIAHGMATTFLADFDAVVDNYDAAVRGRGMGRDERIAATAGIKAAIAAGLDAVRALDAIVTNHLRGDEVTRTVWDRDCRVVYRQPLAPQAPATTVAAAPAAATLTVPAPMTAAESAAVSEPA